MDEALEGGISDPRNASVFKMFVLVNVGERIGSGLQNLCYVWEQMGLEVPVLRESFSPDRMRLDVVLWNGDNASGEGVDNLELTPPS